MSSPLELALPSAFGLTCLLFVGLGFFIRASTKDRTETALYFSELNEVDLLEALKQYFANRAYRVTQIDSESGRIALEGRVGASLFLAIFLGGLAATGCFCLALVITIAAPQLGTLPYFLLLGSPLASWFYWRGANRVEQVTFQFPGLDLENLPANPQPATPLKVSAHRDELLVLESQLPLKRVETE